MWFVEKNTHAMNTGGSISGLWKEHTCSDSNVGFSLRTQMDPYVVCAKEHNAMTSG